MAAFGGGQYSGPDPAAYAAGKGMAASQIDMLAGHVASAMTELGMPPVSFRGYVPPVSCAASQDEWGNAIVKRMHVRPWLLPRRSASRRRQQRLRRPASGRGCLKQ